MEQRMEPGQSPAVGIHSKEGKEKHRELQDTVTHSTEASDSLPSGSERASERA
jgi:hypothetical protein